MQLPTRLSDGAVVLRQIEEDDRADVLRTMRDPLVRRWLNMPTDPADWHFDELRRRVAEGRQTGERFDYVVADPVDDRAVGAVIASRRHRENYELAYLAGQEGRGRGLMSRALPCSATRCSPRAWGVSRSGPTPGTPSRNASPSAPGSCARAASAGRSGSTAAGRTRSSGRCSPTTHAEGHRTTIRSCRTGC